MSFADVERSSRFFANATSTEDAAVDRLSELTMMRHYAQLCASLRLGRNQLATVNGQSPAANIGYQKLWQTQPQPLRNLTSSSSAASSSQPPQSCKQSTNPDNLPHYPVPPLQDTLQKYLRSVRPLLNDEEFRRSEQVVGEFAGEGSKLHAMLSARAAERENWLSEWWLKYAYLGFRAPVVINSNPGLYYDVRPFGGVDEWLSHTARTIWATMRYKEQIDAKQIPVDRMGKFPLDMAQYGMIFGTCRIPRESFDGIEYHPDSNYVVVAYRNGFYKLPVYSSANSLLTESELFTLLQQIVADNGTNPPIGALTAQHRDKLAVAYAHLNATNRAAVKTIQSSLFLVCLDQTVPFAADNATQSRHNVGSHQLIHGGGSAQNSANRWYDKTLQLVVNENGLIGLNYEHSPGEGQPIAVLSDFIMSHTKANCTVLKPCDVAQKPLKLTFTVDALLQQHLDAAVKHTDELAHSLDMHVLDFTAYGKDFIKKQKMSPDSFIQMAMQYAFYKKHGVPGAHYESAQQRMFIHGRTETIRSCSCESLAFAQAMCSPSVGDAERVRLLREAVNAHKDYTVMAMRGEGVDRLLLGLKLTAIENKLSVPALYADASFVRSTHYRISTSQVASQHKAFMCYGPAVLDGYGICYNPREHDMLLAVSAFRECRETSAAEMADALRSAFEDMREVLVRAGDAKPTSKL